MQAKSSELQVPLEVLVLSNLWLPSKVDQVLLEAQSILSQCGVLFSDVIIKWINAPEHLQDLDVGSSKTILKHVRSSGLERRISIIFARDTRMEQPYDAEAFGQGNTRTRPWLSDTAWLTLALADKGIALAHELFHVLLNSGLHTTQPGNLMLARTTGKNRELMTEQCGSCTKTLWCQGWLIQNRADNCFQLN